MSLYLLNGNKVKKLKDKFFDLDNLISKYEIDDYEDNIAKDLNKAYNRGLDYYIWFSSYAYEIHGKTILYGGFDKEKEINSFWTNIEEI